MVAVCVLVAVAVWGGAFVAVGRGVFVAALVAVALAVWVCSCVGDGARVFFTVGVSVAVPVMGGSYGRCKRNHSSRASARMMAVRIASNFFMEGLL